jgi:hypothetical protein
MINPKNMEVAKWQYQNIERRNQERECTEASI